MLNLKDPHVIPPFRPFQELLPYKFLGLRSILRGIECIKVYHFHS